MTQIEAEKICWVCLAGDPSDLVEPVTTPCGHLLCWPCLFQSVKASNMPKCPVCKTAVETIQPLYGLGKSRGVEHFDIPARPMPGENQFESLSFLGIAPRRSTRPRVANSRLTGYDQPSVSATRRTVPSSPEESDTSEEPPANTEDGIDGRLNQPDLPGSSQVLDQPSQQSSHLAVDFVDFSDDDDIARREFEAENAEHLRTPVSTRFKIKESVPGANDKIHLDIVISEVEELLISNQCKIKHINWSQVARNLRRGYPLSFPGPNNTLKSIKSVSRLCQNALIKAVAKFKRKMAIMNRTGNTGPPDTSMEISLRAIISVDEGAPDNNQRLAPSGRPSTRPVILDPQPISRTVAPELNRTPLTESQRTEADAALNLDQPTTQTHRQQRLSLARQGQVLRENSLAEQQERNEQPSRRRSSTTGLRGSGAAAVAGAASNVQAMGSERSNVEAMILNSMEMRRIERQHEREERQRLATLDKEEREVRAKMEREERERKDRREKEERDSRDLLLFSLIGLEKKRKKQIKVQAAALENTDSQPLPLKINLTTLSALLKDLCDYMAEADHVDGVVLEDDDGDRSIITNIDSILEMGRESFTISKLDKRGKSYFCLV